jgi:DNA transposition AAA+ family ATPase
MSRGTIVSENINKYKGRNAPLANLGLFSTLVESVMSRRRGLSGLAIFHGPSGYGKSISAVYAANKYQAYYIECGDSWTRKSFLEVFLKELGGDVRGSIPQMMAQIIELAISLDRPIIIDEFDYIVDKNILGLVREIHDKTHAPIILIGEERLPKKLEKYERFHNRILHWQAAQPLLLEEMIPLAQIYAPNVEIADDLLKHIYAITDKRVRRAANNIDMVRQEAITQGLTKISLKDWGNRPLFTGQAPRRGEL